MSQLERTLNEAHQRLDSQTQNFARTRAEYEEELAAVQNELETAKSEALLVSSQVVLRRL